MKLRILVADDNEQFLVKTVSLLETEFEVVATATDGQSAIASASSCSPDIVVLDLEMPGINGIEVTRQLVKQYPSLKAIIYSLETAPEIVAAALQAGALAYVFKSLAVRDLVLAVKSVARGQLFVSSDGHLHPKP